MKNEKTPEQEEEFKRIFEIYKKGVFDEGWIKSCAERAIKLPFEKTPISIPYKSVQSFFDEAIKSYIHGLYKGCIALCRSTLEAALEEKSKLPGIGLQALISKCDGDVLPHNLVCDAKYLVNWGDTYSHADTNKWINVNRATNTTFVKQPFEPTLGDEHIALECISKIRKIIFELYKMKEDTD